MLEVYLSLLNLLLEKRDLYDLEKPQRRAMFAGKLVQFAQYSFRSGEKTLALEAFRKAKALSSHPLYEERRWYRAIAAVTGFANLEMLLSQFRRK